MLSGSSFSAFKYGWTYVMKSVAFLEPPSGPEILISFLSGLGPGVFLLPCDLCELGRVGASDSGGGSCLLVSFANVSSCKYNTKNSSMLRFISAANKRGTCGMVALRQLFVEGDEEGSGGAGFLRLGRVGEGEGKGAGVFGFGVFGVEVFGVGVLTGGVSGVAFAEMVTFAGVALGSLLTGSRFGITTVDCVTEGLIAGDFFARPTLRARLAAGVGKIRGVGTEEEESVVVVVTSSIVAAVADDGGDDDGDEVDDGDGGEDKEEHDEDEGAEVEDVRVAEASLVGDEADAAREGVSELTEGAEMSASAAEASGRQEEEVA